MAPEITADIEVLLRACISAKHALRSYQYGNSSPDLAQEIADKIDDIIDEFPKYAISDISAQIIMDSS